MAGKKGAAQKRTKASGRQTKLPRADSENTALRKAITEIQAGTGSNSSKTYKPDSVLVQQVPEAAVYNEYSCMLNQTNIGDNNNKFYVIQVAQDGDVFYCFTRWGRVGEVGMFKNDDFDDIDDAISAFKKKFKDKTANDWDKRDNFTPKTKKYTLLEMDDGSDDEDEPDGSVTQVVRKTIGNNTISSRLDLRTQLLIKLIFCDDMFVQQMASLQLDVRKMPLGKLSKVQIAKGLSALIEIEDALKNKKDRNTLADLTSKFYTLVPHSFGRSVPPVLDNMTVIRQKKDLMITLGDIELTQTMQKNKNAAEANINPLDAKMEMLSCQLKLLDKSSSEYKLIHKYATACKNSRKGTLLDVWTVDRDGESSRFNQNKNIKQRKLLWHGTNVAVVAAILGSGLRIMPHSGGRVGRGIYFASEHAKSSFYVSCHYGTFEGEKNVGFMFLVEVALGKQSEITQSVGNQVKAPPGYDSIVARGMTEPDRKYDQVTKMEGNDVTLPLGPPVNQAQFKNSHFCQSEYLVYREDQARLRYLLKFSFD